MLDLYWESHPGLAKHPTLFIHGNLASTRWWGPTLENWRAMGALGPAPLMMADWRGCGQNPAWAPDEPFTINDLAQDFLNALNQREIKEIDLVGHSLGGLIALQLMSLAPGRVRKAVLLDPVGARGVTFDESMYEAFNQMARSRDLTKMVILSTVHSAETLDPAYAEALADDAFKAVRGIGHSVLEILKTVNLESAAQQVATPTLILHGEHDQIISQQTSEQLARLMPHAQFERLADAGHCWNIENPKRFTHRLKEWFI